MTKNTPNGAKAWKTAIMMPNNSSFIARCFGFAGVYLFQATPFSAVSIAKDTGAYMVQVCRAKSVSGEDAGSYYLIGSDEEKVRGALAVLRDGGHKMLTREGWDAYNRANRETS